MPNTQVNNTIQDFTSALNQLNDVQTQAVLSSLTTQITHPTPPANNIITNTNQLAALITNATIQTQAFILNGFFAPANPAIAPQHRAEPMLDISANRMTTAGG